MNDSDRQDVQNDFEYSRKIYLDLIATGQEALQGMLDVADQTQHPRSYEVLSGMIKNISDVNDRLMHIHKKKKDIQKSDQPAALPGAGTTNNLFVGSTAELQKMLLSQSKKKEENVIDISDYTKDE